MGLAIDIIQVHKKQLLQGGKCFQVFLFQGYKKLKMVQVH